MQMTGVLFFPVTPFDAGGAVAADVLADHVEAGMRHEPGGVFAACGTGEFAALSGEEQALVVQTAVKVVDGRVPVIAGAGGSLPHAIDGVRRAAGAGADGVLLLPPYLVTGPPEGLVRYVTAVAEASAVPIVVYQRANARFTAETAVAIARLDNVVGFKDGLGDLDRMHRIVLAVRDAVGDDFQFFNGMPTAEMTVHAYRGIGVDLYSSAVFCFAPQISTAFFRSLYHDDGQLAQRLLSEFYRPFVELRDRVPGYAVALVKAAVRASGLDVGSVRPPLVDPAPAHLDELHRIVAAGLGVIDAD
jgi:5-dehydro-4-deoxyglucarate dehydratase